VPPQGLDTGKTRLSAAFKAVRIYCHSAALWPGVGSGFRPLNFSSNFGNPTALFHPLEGHIRIGILCRPGLLDFCPPLFPFITGAMVSRAIWPPR
jgi:hypothetical protein